MTRNTDDKIKELATLFLSLNDQQQEEALSLLRTLSFAESATTNPAQKECTSA